MQDTSDPDELLREKSRKSNVSVSQHECHDKTEYEQHDSVGVKAEIVARVVDTTPVETIC